MRRQRRHLRGAESDEAMAMVFSPSFHGGQCFQQSYYKLNSRVGSLFMIRSVAGHADFGTLTKVALISPLLVHEAQTAERSLCSRFSVYPAVTRMNKRLSCQIIAHGGRSALYSDVETYVLLEPGEDEQFVTQEELQTRLKSWVTKWPEHERPEDLSRFSSVDEAVAHLIDSACELDLGGGFGSVQWFEVRLESN